MTSDQVDKNTALLNLPSSSRSQHDDFDLLGTGRGETPVARVKHPHRYDLLFDMGLFEHLQVSLAQTFCEWRWNAARYTDAHAQKWERLGRYLSGLPEDVMNQRDCYLRLLIKLRSYDKNILSLIELACAEVDRREDIGALRSALFRIGQNVLAAFDVLDRLIMEVQKEKQEQEERAAARVARCSGPPLGINGIAAQGEKREMTVRGAPVRAVSASYSTAASAALRSSRSLPAYRKMAETAEPDL